MGILKASLMDVTGSIHYYLNTFAEAHKLKFVNTTSIESVTTLMQQGTDQLILVQEKVTSKTFTDIQYRIFISWATSTDSDALKTLDIFNDFMVQFPRFTTFNIYDYKGLLLNQLDCTGIKFVLSVIEQELTSRAQMRNNLASIQFNIKGLANIEVLFSPAPKFGHAAIIGESYMITKPGVLYISLARLEALGTMFAKPVVNYAGVVQISSKASLDTLAGVLYVSSAALEASAEVVSKSGGILYSASSINGNANMMALGATYMFSNIDLSGTASLESTPYTLFVVNNGNSVVNNGVPITNT